MDVKNFRIGRRLSTIGMLECGISQKQIAQTLGLRIPPSKKQMIWLTAYDESRAIRDVKRGKVSQSRSTGTFQTVFDCHY